MALRALLLLFAAPLLTLGQELDYASWNEDYVSPQGLSRLANGFIVEYADVPEKLDLKAVFNNVTTQVDQVTGGAVQVILKMELRSSLFNGASFRILPSTPSPEQTIANAVRARKRSAEGGSADDAVQNRLMEMPSIASVYPNLVYTLQRAMDSPNNIYSEKEIESFLKPRQHGAGGADNSSGIIYPAEGTPLINPHMLTGVDKLHAEGVGGQGIKIAIIDSGIDPYIETLGGGYGPGNKVLGGYDFVGDQPNNDVDPPAPDDSPITTCSNHGTAVSSIAAGLPAKFGFVGVAPNASILSYKVFPCSGVVGTDTGVNASLTAYEDGADIINASIGAQGGWGNDLWSVIARRIMDMGVTYMLPAGNEGSRGTFIANGLSSGIGVPSVGSVDNAYTTTLITDGSYTVDGGESVPIKYAPGFPSNWTYGVSETAPLELFLPPVYVNGCVPYPKNVTYTNNSVLLVPRPPAGAPACDLNARAKEAGIRKMLFYNWIDNNPLRPLAVQTQEGFPFDWLDAAANIDHALGVKLSELVANGSKVVVDFPWRPDNDTRVPRVQENYLTAGFMSNFSTWGPTYEAKIGTTFSAPGGQYIAAGATIYGEFVVASGTSFSSPYAAGAAALVKQMHPNITPDDIINRLATTAKPIQYQDNLRNTKDYLAPTFQAGAGLIDVYAAVHTTTTFNVSDLAFNDTAFIEPKSFEVFNGGNGSVSYEITHTPGPTVYTFYNQGNITATSFSNNDAFNENILPTVHAALEFSTTSITVNGGASSVVTVTATPPKGLDAKRLALYSGFVTITASDGYNLSIPYGGIASPLRDVQVLDMSPGQERTFLIANTTGGNVRPGIGNNLTTNFVIPKLSGNITTSTELWNVTLPGLQVTTVFGSLQGEAVIMKDGVSLGSFIDQAGDAPLLNTKIVRGSTLAELFYGKMADGSFLEAGGPYRFRVRMLRVTGDPAKDEDWDLVVTEPFQITYE